MTAWLKQARGRELPLLAFPPLLLWAGFASQAANRHGEISSAPFAILIVLVVGVLVVHVWLTRHLRRADQLLFPLTMMLAAIGLIMVSRLRPDLLPRQALWLVIGLGALIAGTLVATRAEWLREYRYTIGAAGLLLTAATLVLGVDPNESGARLWFVLGGVFFQPIEVLKVLLVITLAGYLDEHGPMLRYSSVAGSRGTLPSPAYLVPLGIMLALTEGLLMLQHDLGAGLLISITFLIMVYVVSGRASLVAAGIAGLSGAGWIAFHTVAHARQRFDIWLNPWDDPSGLGYQSIQALIGFANGGLLGTGLGLGRPDLIPAAHTDYVLAAIGEELGLAGSLACIALFALVVQRGFVLALRIPTSYERILATGLTSILAVQALIIIGGTVRLIPLTGITLPWVSYGGSSIVANCAVIGLLLGLSHAGHSRG